MIKICNRIIEFAFYALFFLTPLVFTSDTYELFEFPKMWLVFALTLLITASWAIKMVLEGRIAIQRSPLDIPIALFLLSQIISTIFSLDIHVSMWGYYSRFNGGLFSILAYIFLYYALVSNFSEVKRFLLVSLFSGAIVALWGLPSHFGYDPTCLLLRGSLDVSCWTEAFQPKIRIFSTLGQPNWLAAYLSILIPIAIAFAIKNSKFEARNSKQTQNSNSQNTKSFGILNFGHLRLFRISDFGFSAFFLFAILFFLALLFTKSQSGFAGAMIALFFFVGAVLFQELKVNKSSILKSHTAGILLIVLVVFGLLFFFAGSPIERLRIQKTAPSPALPRLGEELGGTDSGKIRMIVWKGALEIFKNNPLIGTGVETFAFAYYKYRPLEHNFTSEWDYLYNKAHNEYLNYLATTGIFGLGSYLLMIGVLIWTVVRHLILETRNLKLDLDTRSSKDRNQTSKFQLHDPASSVQPLSSIIVLALLASYLSILVSNFFGFSVVVVNLYFFLLPAFAFILGGMINQQKTLTLSLQRTFSLKTFNFQFSTFNFRWPAVFLIIIIASLGLLTLLRFFLADKAYALGFNLDRTGQYQLAYPRLLEAVTLRSGEPAFMDELSLNNAILSAMLSYQDESTLAAQLKETALKTSEAVLAKHPNNVVFWKTRVRALYALSQVEPEHISLALSAIQNAKRLAPTDAKLSYNLGLLYGQNGQTEKAVEALEEAIKLKPNYYDAYYALGLFYHESALDKQGKVAKPELQEKAVEAMKYILDNFATDDARAIQALKTWGEL